MVLIIKPFTMSHNLMKLKQSHLICDFQICLKNSKETYEGRMTTSIAYYVMLSIIKHSAYKNKQIFIINSQVITNQ